MDTARQQLSDRHTQPAQSCASIDIAWRFQRGQEDVLVRVRDIGDEVEIWTLAVVGSEVKTQARERSAKPQDILPYLAATKSGFLKDGWKTTRVPSVWKARTAKTTNHLRNDVAVVARTFDMREIRFRAWDIANGSHPAMKYFGLGEAFSNLAKCPIMQFTGVLDRDGKELYEGDIVRSSATGNIPLRLYTIRWNKAQNCFDMSFPKGLSTSISTDVELVGNIHEDRHLLTTRPVDITGPATANDILPRPGLLAAPAPEQEVELAFEVVESE